MSFVPGGRAVIKSLDEGRAWVRDNRMLWDRAGLVLLSGPMGAGKTQVAQWMVSVLGGTEAASPTFAIHHRYACGKRTVDHFDLYRLKNDEELESTGFWDIVGQSDNLVLVEWADRLPMDVYPSARAKLTLNISAKENGERVFTW